MEVFKTAIVDESRDKNFDSEGFSLSGVAVLFIPEPAELDKVPEMFTLVTVFDLNDFVLVELFKLVLMTACVEMVPDPVEQPISVFTVL
ncbi:hypothetical protein N7454_010827 [Penicillium verhagenii]|nr:hypothetical protein N7454_010827 [Penicillium verhagenii]